MAKLMLVIVMGVLGLLAVACGDPASSLEESTTNHEFVQEFSRWCRNNSYLYRNRRFLREYEAISKVERNPIWIKMNDTLTSCLTTSVDIENCRADFNALSNETRTSFFSRYYPQMMKAFSCQYEVLEAAKSCLTEYELIFDKAKIGSFLDAVELICKNNGEILFDLDAPNNMKCSGELVDYVETCIKSFVEEIESWDFSHLTPTQCGFLSILRVCVMQKLNECEAPNLISMYDRFHNELITKTSCRNLTDRREIMQAFGSMCSNSSLISSNGFGYSLILCLSDWGIDMGNFRQDFRSLSNKTRQTFFPRYCPLMKRIGPCFIDALEATKQCFTEYDYSFTMANYQSFPATVDLICKNDGEILFELDEPNTKCFFEMVGYAKNCTKALSVHYESWDFPDLTPTQCGFFPLLRVCVKRKLNECQAPNLLSVYDVFQEALFRQTPCRNVSTFHEGRELICFAMVVFLLLLRATRM